MGPKKLVFENKVVKKQFELNKVCVPIVELEVFKLKMELEDEWVDWLTSELNAFALCLGNVLETGEHFYFCAH